MAHLAGAADVWPARRGNLASRGRDLLAIRDLDSILETEAPEALPFAFNRASRAST
jgi:hypothetical protein